MSFQHLLVEREETASKGRYVVRLEGVEAEMTYSRAGESLIIIDHTDVPDVRAGRARRRPVLRELWLAAHAGRRRRPR